MRKISPLMQARLDADATTFCHCWKLLRRDGVVMGFTDHDISLTFDGQRFTAHAGLDARSAESTLGLAVAGSDVTGALTDDALVECDLANGLYDSASLETWLVDWTDPTFRMLLDVSTLGEVRRTEFAFTAELRGLAHKLDQEVGRRFQKACSADFGDARCGLDLDATGLRATFALNHVTSIGELAFAPGLLPEGGLANGVIQGVSGANAGARAVIRGHRLDAGLAIVTPWTPFAATPQPGDLFALAAGCDKSLATCSARFRNSVNFRGFPHMPGNDVLLAYPSAQDHAMDGGSLFR